MLTNDSNPTCGILYVDDEEKALKYFRMAFADKFQIFTASSGKEAIELLHRESKNIGIVISDQRMPGMLGAEILGIVREKYPNIVRILTTAYSDLESAIQAVNKGHIYQYIVKPWEIPELRMVLQRAADYHRILTERNELLSLKMTTLQRIVCSDRVKWLLLSSRYWDPSAQSAFQRALFSLITALPASPAPFLSSGGKFNAQRFDIAGLIRDEYQNASRYLTAVDELRTTPAAPEAHLKDLAAKISEMYQVAHSIDLAGAKLRLSPAGDSFPADDFVRTLFGLLFEEKTSGASVALFETLFALGGGPGSLTVSVELPTPLHFTFDLTPDAPTAEEIIEALAAKYSAWDIARL